ncbi:MAG: hypothetical protein IT310_13015 [Anaerolineales bacterium]|nr:hypothetical protein [Anaerolineales bacterium]
MESISIEHSADWRFLLPISQESKCLLVGRDLEDVAQLFTQLGFSAQVVGFSALQEKSQSALVNFDFALLPFGFSSAMAVEALTQISKTLRPGGQLLLGFSNLYNLRPTRPTETLPFSPAQIRKALSAAGYAEATFYAALPNLQLTEYIFPVNRQAAAFALDRRYQHKIPVGAKSWRALFAVAPYLLNFFPAYFVTAKLP